MSGLETAESGDFLHGGAECIVGLLLAVSTAATCPAYGYQTNYKRNENPQRDHEIRRKNFLQGLLLIFSKAGHNKNFWPRAIE